jgi:drug/metabolite transporter (DMT)-like permease
MCVSENGKYYAALIFCMFAWGASWVAIKVLVGMAPPMTIGFFRYTVALVLFISLLRFRENALGTILKRGTIRNFLIGGITGIFAFMVIGLIGTSFTTASQASIIAGLNPVTVTFFAFIIHKERLARSWQYLGFISAFIGITFVIGVQALLDYNPAYILGNILLIFAMIMWGLYSSIGKNLMKTVTPAEATAGSILFGWLIFGVAAISEVASWPLILTNVDFWVNVIFLGAFSSFLGFMFYFESIKRIGATKTGAFISLVPVFGTITAILLLQDPVYWTFIVGLVFVIIGVLIINAPIDGEQAETYPSR